MPPNSRRARMSKMLLLSASLAVALGRPSLAQSETETGPPGARAAPGAVDIVELPPLIADLFRSTPQGADAGPPAASLPPAGTGPAGPAIAISGAFVPDEVLVTIEGDAAAAAQIAAANGLQVRSARTSFLLGTTVARFGIPDGRPVGLVLAQLLRDGRAAAQEPNHIYTLQQAEAVSGYTLQNIAFDPREANGDSIRIAVIDTARDKTHPALAGIAAEDFDALPDVPVVNSDHATSIVGLIAGQDGFQGLAPGALIFHARAFENGRSNADAILAALDWSAQQNARIINMSFVGPRNRLFELACAKAHERGILLVAAAGNNGPKAPPAFPGAFKNVVAVTATDEQNKRMEEANVGAYIRISAPGVGVMAPIPGGGYDLVTGTSFAAAVYTGAIANLMRRAPGETAFRLDDRIAKTALDLGGKGRDAEFGFGLVNLKAALSAQ
jgi:subtilisin family serine protease